MEECARLCLKRNGLALELLEVESPVGAQAAEAMVKLELDSESDLTLVNLCLHLTTEAGGGRRYCSISPVMVDLRLFEHPPGKKVAGGSRR